MRALLAVILGLGASVGLADDYDPLVLQACLDINHDDKTACIGVAATRCMYGAGRGSTATAVRCMTAELGQWDEMLNEVYAELKDHDSNLDAQSQNMAADIPRLAPSLTEMQRQWMAFRDASCTYAAAEWGDGSQAQVAMASCRMRMTGAQALKLQGRLFREIGA